METPPMENQEDTSSKETVSSNIGRQQSDDDLLMEETLIGMHQGFDRGAGLKPFGAVVARDGVIIAKAINTCVRDCDPTAHAEMNAIRSAALKLGSHDLSGCTLYASAQPCPMCSAAAFHAGIERILYASTWTDYQDLFPDRACFDQIVTQPGPTAHLSRQHQTKALSLWHNYRQQNFGNPLLTSNQ